MGIHIQETPRRDTIWRGPHPPAARRPTKSRGVAWVTGTAAGSGGERKAGVTVGRTGRCGGMKPLGNSLREIEQSRFQRLRDCPENLARGFLGPALDLGQVLRGNAGAPGHLLQCFSTGTPNVAQLLAGYLSPEWLVRSKRGRGASGIGVVFAGRLAHDASQHEARRKSIRFRCQHTSVLSYPRRSRSCTCSTTRSGREMKGW